MKHNGMAGEMPANHYPTIEDLKLRASKIGLSVAVLANEAGLSRPTVSSPKRAKAPNTATIEALLGVIEPRERDLLRHLIALHGIPEAHSEQAA